MVKRIWQIGALSLLAAALAAAPTRLAAQTTNTAPAEKKAAAKKDTSDKKEASEKKQHPLPFNGDLTAVDSVAKTITVGKRTFQITSETKIYKGTKTPATLEQGVVGESVRGSYRKAADGKLVANSVYFGAKDETKAAKAPEKKTPDAAADKK